VGLVIGAIDQTIVATALTSIQADLGAPITWVGWTITVYALIQIVARPLAGRLSDTIGAKNVFVAAATVFTVSSLGCSLAHSMAWLLVLRAVQSAGGGAFVPCASGIVSELFGRQRDRAIGLFTSIFPVGAVAGPILGGYFVTYWDWRGIFLVNVPIGALVLVLGIRFIPPVRPKPSTRSDPTGALLLATTLLSGMLAVTLLAEGISRHLAVVVPLGAGACTGGLWFLHRARRNPESFIAGDLLYGHGFRALNSLNLMYGAAVLGFGALVPMYAERRFGLGALEAGSVLSARAVTTFGFALAAVWVMRRTGYRSLMLAGYFAVVVGTLASIVVPRGPGAYWWLAACAGISGVGMGLAAPASNNAAMQLARDHVSAVAGLTGMFRQAGGIVAISVSTALVSASSDAASALTSCFLALAISLLVVMPLAFRFPNHRGGW
jgi:MFS family permease